MSVPAQEELVNPLLGALHAKGGRLSVTEQEKEVATRLQLSDRDLAEQQTDTRSKLSYRLAWARNYLKRLGLIENIERGVWQLTIKGSDETEVSMDAIRELGRSLELTDSIGTGVESEDVEAHIVKPFDPTLIRVDSKPATLGQLITRMELKEIDLAPAFQRKAGIWNDGAQSRLIESILVRIPIPAFYFDAANEDKWVVVDGLQRLTAIKRFVLEKSLRLQGMEFLDTMEGKTFDQLPRSLQRRISESGITVFLIEKNTPPTVKFNIFKRINTGGLPLSPQEIRHALNQGKVTTLLSELAASPEFKKATNDGIRDERMADRECVLRFLAFSISSPSEYRASDFDGFLSEKMAGINDFELERVETLRTHFLTGMTAAHRIFSREAFRKPFRLYGRRMPINKALFEVWSVNFGKLTPKEIEILYNRRHELSEKFFDLCLQLDFSNAISQGTGDPVKVRRRFGKIEDLIHKLLE